ncbi:nucleoside recognition domain-containing protein [Thiothrix lacustris]|uniref:nucleoside recognition domain-containing protein n=1 Tax=Thiothrix lacustris TaxID=525917 RepID=UPI000491F50E|nr:nucleoside recognition domain-containing protein [Thiothrix lacustris]
METIIQVILAGGRTGVDLALYTLLPIMVVMLALMKLLDAWGVLAWVARLLSPVLKPFGIPGLGIFAAVKMLLVSFAAPIPTFALMGQGGTSRRHIAATLAMMMVMTQANVSFPLAAFGLDVGMSLFTSVLGGLLAASVTYHYLTPKTGWDDEAFPAEAPDVSPYKGKNAIRILSDGGLEGMKIVVNSIPMLVLALCFVNALKASGAIVGLTTLLAPVLALIGLPEAAVLPLITKFIAGGTAFMAVTIDLIQQGSLTALELNRMVGFATNPLDIVGIALFASVHPRVAEVMRPALLGACAGLLVRGTIHLILY